MLRKIRTDIYTNNIRFGFLWLAAACLFVAASASAGEVSNSDRFGLWNDCRPMFLLVEEPGDGATAIGLTQDEIIVAVRSRLRAARIYSEDFDETALSLFYVNVNVLRSAYGIRVEYKKIVEDLATFLVRDATTWKTGSTGTHGRDPNFILSHVARYTDKFIDEYLRVNANACK